MQTKTISHAFPTYTALLKSLVDVLDAPDSITGDYRTKPSFIAAGIVPSRSGNTETDATPIEKNAKNFSEMAEILHRYTRAQIGQMRELLDLDAIEKSEPGLRAKITDCDEVVRAHRDIKTLQLEFLTPPDQTERHSVHVLKSAEKMAQIAETILVKHELTDAKHAIEILRSLKNQDIYNDPKHYEHACDVIYTAGKMLTQSLNNCSSGLIGKTRHLLQQIDDLPLTINHEGEKLHFTIRNYPKRNGSYASEFLLFSKWGAAHMMALTASPHMQGASGSTTAIMGLGQKILENAHSFRKQIEASIHKKYPAIDLQELQETLDNAGLGITQQQHKGIIESLQKHLPGIHVIVNNNAFQKYAQILKTAEPVLGGVREVNSLKYKKITTARDAAIILEAIAMKCSSHDEYRITHELSNDIMRGKKEPHYMNEVIDLLTVLKYEKNFESLKPYIPMLTQWLEKERMMSQFTPVSAAATSQHQSL